MLYVKRLTATAQLPKLGSTGAAGFDLYADETVTVPEFSRMRVKTGIAVSIDPGKCGLIWPRSGLAAAGISTDAGVIDSDYRGEVVVILTNMTKHRYTAQQGERIAQMIIQPAFQDTVEECDELINSERAAGGFGSTGV